MKLKDHPIETRKFIHSLIFPLFFLLIIWAVKLVETAENMGLGYLGIMPRKLEGLVGILLTPLIHGSFRHLFDNSLSLLVLSVTLFYFYNTVAYRVFFAVYLAGGLMVWIVARPAYHIGASGIIYGLGAFLFFSGIIRQHIHLLAISLLVTFLYGSMFWGMFPTDDFVSWESHLAGGVAGFLLSIWFRNVMPPVLVMYAHEPYLTDDEEDDDAEPYWLDEDLEDREDSN